jgi:hypothetical protein
MTRVKGLAFVSFFALALSAHPVLSQDRNSDLPPPTSRGTNADAPPANPQNNPTTKPPRQRADGEQHNGSPHRRKPNGDPSQAQGSDGRTNGSNRQGPPPGPPQGGQPPQGSGQGSGTGSGTTR